MKASKKIILTVMAFVAITFMSMNVQSKLMDNWKLLGSRIVDYGIDHDNISLEKSKEAYSAIKFKVKEGSVNVYKSTVFFVNGEKQDIELKDFSTATDGKEIDLNGDKQTIEKITFWYNTKIKSDQRSVIEVWGLR